MISQREESEEDSYRRVTRRNQRESEEELHKESEGGVRGRSQRGGVTQGVLGFRSFLV